MSAIPQVPSARVCHLERGSVVDPRRGNDADKVAAEERVESDLDVEGSRPRDLERQRLPVEWQAMG
jgi:hypothetical protein